MLPFVGCAMHLGAVSQMNLNIHLIRLENEEGPRPARPRALPMHVNETLL